LINPKFVLAATCGNGSRGDGVCSNGMCCSQVSWGTETDDGQEVVHCRTLLYFLFFLLVICYYLLLSHGGCSGAGVERLLSIVLALLPLHPLVCSEIGRFVRLILSAATSAAARSTAQAMGSTNALQEVLNALVARQLRPPLLLHPLVCLAIGRFVLLTLSVETSAAARSTAQVMGSTNALPEALNAMVARHLHPLRLRPRAVEPKAT
jgi:hypothetical protein